MIKKIIKITIICLVPVIVLLFCIIFMKAQIEKNNRQSKSIGVPFEQSGIKKEYEKILQEYQHIKKADVYLKKGEIEKAIEQYNIVIRRNKKTGAILDAKRGLINAYEKIKDYKKAGDLLLKIINKYKVLPDHIFRVPDEERLKYLIYAANGEYELAIEHAQKALEADAKLPNRPKEGRADYIERLNDLKDAKDYILSLKKSNQ